MDTVIIALVLAVLYLAPILLLFFYVRKLKSTGYLKTAIKGGVSCFLACLVAAFVFGLFVPLHIGHGSGLEGASSGVAYSFLFFLVLGPLVLVISGLLIAALARSRKASKAMEGVVDA